MSFAKQPVVNVKTSDNTGYIIEYLTQTTMGPGGCVRVTTRDVLKLSAVCLSVTDIVPHMPTPPNANRFFSFPEPVQGKMSFSNMKQLTSIDLDPKPGQLPIRPGDIRTDTVSMEDVACCTDSICQATSWSQTEIVKFCERGCGQEDESDKESENGSSKESDTRDKMESVNSTIKKCTCPKKRSVKAEETKSPDSKTEKMETDSQHSEGEKDRPEEIDCKSNTDTSLCKKCKRKSSEEKISESETSLRLNDKSENSPANKCSRVKTNKQHEKKSDTCQIRCEGNHKGKHHWCTALEGETLENGKNDSDKDTKINEETSEMDICNELCHTRGDFENAESFMKIDIINNYNSSSSCTESSTEESSDEDSSGSQSICCICRAAAVQLKMDSKSDTVKPDSEMVESEKSSCEQNKSRKNQTKDVDKEKKNEPLSNGSEMSVIETETTDESLQKCHAKIIHMKDECVQCVKVDYVSVCVDTSDGPGEQIEGEDLKPETSVESKPSLTQSIKDFVTRYVWGDPITKDASTQNSGPPKDCNEQCFVWYLKRSSSAIFDKSDKDRSTKMDIDDVSGYNRSRKDNLKHILKKPSEKSLLKKTSESTTFKRNVNFNPQPLMYDYESYDNSDDPNIVTILEHRNIEEVEDEHSEIYEIPADPRPLLSEGTGPIRKADISYTSLPIQQFHVLDDSNDNSSLSEDDASVLSLTSENAFYEDESFNPTKKETGEKSPLASDSQNHGPTDSNKQKDETNERKKDSKENENPQEKNRKIKGDNGIKKRKK